MTTDLVDASTIEVRPEHALALADMDAWTARIRYACEHQAPPVTVYNVRQWLAAYGYPTREGQRTYVSKIVNTWRAERGMSDTADQLPLTPERLAELDEIAARTGDPGEPAVPAPVPAPAASAPEHQGDAADESDGQGATEATEAPAADKARGTGPFYLVALVGSLISLDTAWRFFDTELHIKDVAERIALSGVAELTLIACGYAMSHAVRRPGGKPGPAQLLAYGMCATATFMAITIGGPVGGTVRALLGPILALVALHLALGIEVKARKVTKRVGTWARVGRELRERLLSRLGLADDSRTALTRTRDRAADRAARLAAAKWAIFRTARLSRAVRASNAALDATQRDRVKKQVAALKNLDDLVKHDGDSPWS